MLAVPLSGTSRRDPAPGALTRGPGGSAHVDSGGGAREPGAAQRARGPVPPPGRPLRPASCDPGKALPPGRLGAKLLLAWGGERRLPASQVSRECGRSYSRSISSIDPRPPGMARGTDGQETRTRAEAGLAESPGTPSLTWGSASDGRGLPADIRTHHLMPVRPPPRYEDGRTSGKLSPGRKGSSSRPPPKRARGSERPESSVRAAVANPSPQATRLSGPQERWGAQAGPATWPRISTRRPAPLSLPGLSLSPSRYEAWESQPRKIRSQFQPVPTDRSYQDGTCRMEYFKLYLSPDRGRLIAAPSRGCGGGAGPRWPRPQPLFQASRRTPLREDAPPGGPRCQAEPRGGRQGRLD